MDFITSVFQTAQDNMDMDLQLLEKCCSSASQNKQLSFNDVAPPSYFRSYFWPNPGITFPKGRTLPHEFKSFDIGCRLTGGGLVFHSPNDLVFSFIGALNHPELPIGFKEKVFWFSQLFQHTLSSLGIVSEMGSASQEKNILYCLHYPNPYELLVNGHKVVAFAFRRYQRFFIMQGIIHVQNGFDFFPESIGISVGLKGKINVTLIQEALHKTILLHFKKG